MGKKKEVSFVEHVEKDLLDIIYARHDFGFYDGGCLIFASALSNIMNSIDIENTIVSVGRENIRDHFVVMTKTHMGVTYIDAEGIYSKNEIEAKIKSELSWVAKQEPMVIEFKTWDANKKERVEAEYDKETVREIEKSFKKKYILFLKDDINSPGFIPTLLGEEENIQEEKMLKR